ncbi:MAG: hypothetical protein GJ680_09745 [Alteromonadaceae bacterium]|nr:hypothetical protein [Alteromonadaceae bacterium]
MLKEKKLVSLIWDKGKHNAFTDLCVFEGSLWCCFREATNHVSKDGLIRILQLNSNGELLNVDTIRMPEADLRDPKLTVTPEGQLLLLAYRVNAKNSMHINNHQPVCWLHNVNGTWSMERSVGNSGWWLWRIRWHRNANVIGDLPDHAAFGFAYNMRQERLMFYSGDPRRKMTIVNEDALSKRKDGLGYPNESDLFFDHEKAFAVVRRDADTYTAQLGESTYPFKNWKWYDLGEYIGGPCILPLSNNQALVAGRIFNKKQLKTALWLLDLHSKKLTLSKILPSGGDNSYPGLALFNDKVSVSYYSSHQHGKSCIYLTHFEREELIPC